MGGGRSPGVNEELGARAARGRCPAETGRRRCTATGGAADARCWWRGRGRLALAGACCARAPRARPETRSLAGRVRDRSRCAAVSVGRGGGAGCAGLEARGGLVPATARGSSRLVGECDGLTITAATQTRTTSAAPATTRRACPAGLVRAGASGCARRARPRGARRTTARSSDSAAAPIAAAAGSALASSAQRVACRVRKPVVIALRDVAPGGGELARRWREYVAEEGVAIVPHILVNRDSPRKGGNRCDRGPRRVRLSQASRLLRPPVGAPAPAGRDRRHRARMITVRARPPRGAASAVLCAR